VHSHGSCSVQPVVGRESPTNPEAKQVMLARSKSLQETYNTLSLLQDIDIISDMTMPPDRKDT
jgi:hypothetical protein